MKNVILAMFAAISFSINARADIPKCWISEGAGDIVDGQYKVIVSTNKLSARQYANILFQLQGAPLVVLADGTTSELSYIEIDLQALLPSDWRPSMGYPTFQPVEQEAINFLEELAKQPGVKSISCISQMRAIPHPGVSVGN
jgi:hypothetical protein